MGTPTVAIVGVGPRGLYCLDALSTAFRANPLRAGVQVAIFDKSNRFGASPIYDPDLPPWLLSNGRAKEIDVGGPGFLHWHNTKFRPSAPIGPDTFPPRAVVGRYLREVFHQVVSRLPIGMRLSTFTSEVTDILPGAHGYRLRFAGGELVAHKVVLTTGHCSYPVVENMGRIPAAARVAMKGIGLTFIDAVLALTEGRGGIFKRDAGGQLRYLASGQEPETVLPFSRSGLPMVPKAVDYPSSPRPLVFVTAERLAELQRRSPGGKLDLAKDVWPLVESEMRTATGEPFACGRVLDPVAERQITTGEEYNSFVEDYLRREIDHARAGLASSPARAAVSLWHEIRATLKPFVAFGGLTPASHRSLLEHYFPLFKRVVFGPPLVNAEKVLALHRAGVLDFSVARGPRLSTRDKTGRFELSTEWSAASAEVLVDARYPTVDRAPLYQGLRRRGMIRAFSNSAYRPGAIDMSRNAQYVIDQRGRPNTDIAVYGTPTEGNLIATFNISRDGYATAWAANVLDQLRGS